MVNNLNFPKDWIAVHVLLEVHLPQGGEDQVKKACGTEILGENLLEQDPVEHNC